MASGWRSVWLAAALLAAGCATTQDSAFQKGQQLLSNGQWEEGIALIEMAVKENPRNLEYRAAMIDARARAENDLARQAAQLRDAGKFSEAEALYRTALRIQPENARAIAGLQQTAAYRRRAALLQEAEAALGKNDLRTAEQNVHTVLTEAPENLRALALARRIDERKPRASTMVTEVPVAMKKPITLQFRDTNLRVIFDAISRETGINFVLDSGIPAAARATILVKNAPIDEAVESLIATNGLAKKVLGESQILIYPNNPQKAREYQELVIRNFYLASADAKQMLNLLRTILKSANIYIDEKRNVLVIRDTAEAVRLAERLIAAHDQAEPEVMLEVEILEVSGIKNTNLGVQFPTQAQFGIVNPITLQALKNLTASDVSVTTGAASVTTGGGTTVPTSQQTIITLNLQKLYNTVNVLANPRIRVRNREKAKIHVGDRVPVIASNLSTTTAVSSQTVNYIDTGIKLEVEPQVLDGEVMIKMTLEVNTLGQQVQVQGSIAYQIGTRNANTTLTLKDGETQILAGLITDADRETINKVPGLGDLPWLGRLFSNTARVAEKTEIILSITPHLLRRMQRPSAELAEYWSGPETNVRSASPQIPLGAIPVPASAPVPQPQPGFSGAAPIPTPFVTAPGSSGATPVPAAPAGPGVSPTPAPAAPPGPLGPPQEFIFQPPPGVGR